MFFYYWFARPWTEDIIVLLWDVPVATELGQKCPQMGQIWDFLRSVSVHFGSPSQNVLKLILKSPRLVTFCANCAIIAVWPHKTHCLLSEADSWNCGFQIHLINMSSCEIKYDWKSYNSPFMWHSLFYFIYSLRQIK